MRRRCVACAAAINNRHQINNSTVDTHSPMPKRAAATEPVLCSECSQAQSKPVVLGKGSTSCTACRKVHEQPPPMQSKRPAPGRAPDHDDASAVRDANAPIKMSQQQYATLMLWLTNDSNRNIVTGRHISSITFRTTSSIFLKHAQGLLVLLPPAETNSQAKQKLCPKLKVLP